MTAKYFGTVRDITGAAQPGASVAVYDSTGALATLTDDNGDAVLNPLEARSDGYYEFHVDDGVYDIEILGNRVRGVAISSSTGDASAYADAAAASAAAAAASALQPVLPPHTVALLPAAPTGNPIAFATDGRKAGEGAGLGTGVLVFWDGAAWIACDTGAPVAA